MFDEKIDSRIINKELILSSIPQQEIFKKYFQISELVVSKLYTNPLREDDDSPGCSFYWNEYGMLKFKDFAAGYNWDCFNVVQLLYNCSFKEALVKIYEHFNLIDDNPTVVHNEIKEKTEAIIARNKKEIKVDIRNWNKKDLEFWNQFCIDEQNLKFHNVYPCSRVWINGRLYHSASESDPCYVYFFGGGFLKVYFPYRKERRFLQNIGSKLEGSQLLSLKGDYCIITKSYKDVMSMYAFNIESIAVPSESYLISDNQYNLLKSRFDNIFTLFDNDRTGIRLAAKHKFKYNIPILMFDKTKDKKDFSDNIKAYGYNYMIDYIEETKERFL